jgi:probable addiction module antidote protein
MPTRTILRDMTDALARDDIHGFIALLYEECRAVGMTEMARRTGLGRESMYKALKPGSYPRFDTITTILRALDIRLVLAPIKSKR